MNPEVKAKWVNALLSGEYHQGQEVLRTSNDNFCCLGVLCDLYAKEHNDEWKLDKSEECYRFNYKYTLPPDYVVEWAGLDDDNPHVYLNGKQITLIALNDGGSSFEEIANVIRKKL